MRVNNVTKRYQTLLQYEGCAEIPLRFCYLIYHAANFYCTGSIFFFLGLDKVDVRLTPNSFFLLAKKSLLSDMRKKNTA